MDSIWSIELYQYELYRLQELDEILKQKEFVEDFRKDKKYIYIKLFMEIFWIDEEHLSLYGSYNTYNCGILIR